jgi:hypothetical protein
MFESVTWKREHIHHPAVGHVPFCNFSIHLFSDRIMFFCTEFPGMYFLQKWERIKTQPLTKYVQNTMTYYGKIKIKTKQGEEERK